MNRIERDQPIITLTNPVPTEGGTFNGKVTKDVYTKTHVPSASLGTIHGVIKGAGFDQVSTDDSRFFDKYGVSSPEDIGKIFQSDILGISATNRNTDSSLDLARQYKESNPKGIVIAGGFGPSMEAEKWLRSGAIDVVLRGEGDVRAPELIKAFVNGKPYENMPGISYVRNGQIIDTPNAPLLTEQQLSETPLPYYPDYIKNKRRTHVVNASRGCFGKCSFCCITVAYEGTYRMKNPKRVAAEIADSKEGEKVFFVDDNLSPSPKNEQSRQLAQTIIDKGLNNRLYLGQVDASFARDLSLVRLWKKAGLFWVFKGFESDNPAALKYVKKAFNADANISSTRTLRKEGIGVHDMFIMAIDGDTPESIEILRQYFRKHNEANTGQVFLLTPLIGTQVGREKAIFDFAQRESNLFDGQHLVTYPPAALTCVGAQDTAVDLYLDLFNNGHLLRTMLKDSRQLFSDPKRALKLLAFDAGAHVYARKTVKDMKKDPYYQDFRKKLGQMDEKRAKENIVFDARKNKPQ